MSTRLSRLRNSIARYAEPMSALRVSVCAAAFAALLASAPVATADPGNDFLAALAAQGFDAGELDADVQLTLSAGQRVCHFLHYGYTPADASMNLAYRYPNATPGQIAGFVQAAQDTLCGPAYTPVEPDW